MSGQQDHKGDLAGAGRSSRRPPSNEMDGLSETSGSLSELRGVLDGLETDQRIEAVARAMAITNRNEDRDREQRRQQDRVDRHEFLMGIHRTLESVLPDVLDVVERGNQVGRTLGMICSPSHLKIRASGFIGGNSMARSFDGLVKMLAKHVALIGGFSESLELYSREMREFIRSSRSEEASVDPDERLKQLEKHVYGILGVVDQVEGRISQFPRFCNELAESVRQDHKSLRERYGDNPGFDEDFDDGMFSFPSSGRSASPSRVPLYKDNPYLTAFLDGIVRQIPDQSDNEDALELQELLEEFETVAFVNLISSISDPVLLRNLRSDVLFKGIAQAVLELYEIYSSVHYAIQSAGLERARDRSPDNQDQVYSKLMEKVEKETPGADSENGFLDIAQFKPGDVISALSRINPASSPKAASSAEEHRSERDRAYIGLFEKIEELLDCVARDSDFLHEADFVAVVGELIERKSGLLEPEKKKRGSQLKRDKDQGNFCYTASQEGMGQLTLKQVPTTNVTFDDVIGASWREVQDKLDGLLEYSEFEYVYSHMSARGKSNNNMLIVGPYGCGKNEFLKALLSDPSVNPPFFRQTLFK